MMKNDTGVREKYIPTDFDTIAYRSKSPKPQGTNGLGFLCFVVGVFLTPSTGKSASAYQKTSLLWGESRE